MVRKAKGVRAGTRKLLKKKVKKQITVNDILKNFEIGERVTIKINSSVHKGMPHPRFHGRTGKVVERRGLAYIVEIKDGRKMKRIIARAEHLMRAGN